jgi:hypothetical protein
VLGFYACKSREQGVCGGESGAFTVVQRTSSDLRPNPHTTLGFSTPMPHQRLVTPSVFSSTRRPG